MTFVDTVLTAWLAFHSSIGVDMQALLLPPATEAEIAEVEQSIGYRLPEDLRDLYKIANGQIGIFGDFKDRSNQDELPKLWAPLFGNYEFLPLDKAVEIYQDWLDIYNDQQAFSEKYNKANPKSPHKPVFWKVREGDALDSMGWKPQWFSFAGNNANHYSVDMAPPDTGAIGQVVLNGADEWELQVVADSVSNLMRLGAELLDADETWRFQFGESDDNYSQNSRPQWATVFFEMDWRREKPQSRSDVNDSTSLAYGKWMNELNREAESRRLSFQKWLIAQGLDEEASEKLTSWWRVHLSSGTIQNPPSKVLNEFAESLRAQGMSDSDIQAELSFFLNEEEFEYQNHASYFLEIASAYLSIRSTQENALPVTPKRAIELDSLFRLERGEISTLTQSEVGQFVDQINQLPNVKKDSFIQFMEIRGSHIHICQPKTGLDTYKKTEHCFDVKIPLHP